MRLAPDDTELEQTEALVADVRRTPKAYASPAALARRLGKPATKVSELLRQHYHASPEDLLLQARRSSARDLLRRSGATPSEAAAEVGARSAAGFERDFRRSCGLDPSDYAALGTARRIVLSLPNGYPVHYLKRSLGRDADSVSERLEGDDYRAAVQIGPELSLIHLRFSPARVSVEWTGGDGYAVHALVVGLLGLQQNAAGFVRVARRAGLSRLTNGRAELRIVQTPSVYEGLLWAIIGQQINLPFAFALRRRLFELVGQRVPGGALIAAPMPEAVARLEPADLLPLQFSRQKADYLIGVSRRIASGELPLETLRSQSATRVERILLTQRGIGPWSVNYLMMRSLGFGDCVPVGDTGLTSGLQRLLRLEERPDAKTTLRLMEVFAPYRSLATAHLWASKQPLP